jgi:hypothetical protein
LVTKPKNFSIESKIEEQQIIKEVQTKSYEIVRLSRIKYFENDYYFIDIRFYNRGYDEKGDEKYFPTKKGIQIKEELFLKIFDKYFFDNLDKLVK